MKAGYLKGSPAPSRSGDAHRLTRHGDHVAPVKLPTAPSLRLAVDGDARLEQQGLRLGPRAGDPGQREELAEPDRVAANLDLVQAA